MITKDKLIQVINKMPGKIYTDDLIEEFVLLSKIELRLADVESVGYILKNRLPKRWENG